MAYKSLQQCISNLDKRGEILKITKEIDPNLEMASVQLDEFAKGKSPCTKWWSKIEQQY